MSRYIVLREKGSADTLLVDKLTKVVTVLDAAAAEAISAGHSSEAGAAFEIAFPVEYRESAPARMFYSESAPKARAA